MRYVTISQGEVAMVDDEDYERVSAHSWHVSRSPTTTYAATSIRNRSGKYRTVFLHRFILNAPAGMHVDHANGDGLNNTRSNLRLATTTQNGQNRRLQRYNRSGFKGVYWDKRREKWIAQLYFRRDGVPKKLFLGRFDAPEVAACAYDRAAVETFGEFARLNFHEQNRDAAADAQAEWDALTEDEQDAAMELAQREITHLEANDAHERECRRLDIASWQTAAQREAAAFEALGDAGYEAWLDARDDRGAA